MHHPATRMRGWRNSVVVVVRVKGVKRYRHPVSGIEYVYHRKTGQRLKAEVGSPEFFAELAAAEARVKPKPQPKSGTLGALIKAYRASPEFQGLMPRTRTDYDKVMNYLADMDGLPLAAITKPFVVKLRDKAFQQRKRSFANYVLAVLSILLAFGMDRELVRSNPVSEVRKIRRRGDAPVRNRPWSSAERDQVLRRAPIHLKLPIAIARWTGLREGDVLQLPKTAYDGKELRRRTSKRGVPVVIPVAGPLRRVIEEAAPHEGMTFCVNSRGKPWTESGFRTSLFKFLKELEREGVVAPGLTFHGLRHSVGTELRELGFDTRTIADMLGQRTEAMAAHYSREADLSRKMRRVVRRMEQANTRGTKVSTKD